MPGTGGELAQHLIERFELTGVKVREGGENENHYSPAEKEVVLSPLVYSKKSLTAVSIAAHEVGHAIQFYNQEPVSQLRSKYFNKAIFVKRVGGFVIALVPFVGFLLKSPQAILAVALIGFITVLSSVSMYAAILPEEYDASFKKALPILSEGYIPESELPKARAILKAAAYTYVAAALADTIRLWRWFRVLR